MNHAAKTKQKKTDPNIHTKPRDKGVHTSH